MKISNVLAAGLALALAAGAAHGYPDKPVQYIIPFPPGGESDITARMQAIVFQAKYKQQMIVLNKPGAGGALVWSTLNSMPADGSIVAGVNLPHIVLQPLEGQVQYKTEDITPTYWFHYTPDAIVVSNDSPVKTFQDLVRLESDQRRGKIDPSRYTTRREELLEGLEHVYGALDEDDAGPEPASRTGVAA